MTISYKANNTPLVCSICRKPIKENERVCQPNGFYGIVCSACENRFEGDDLDFVASLITAFGGYFGKYTREEFSIDSLLEGIQRGGMDKFTEMQVQTFHNGLQYGLSPQEVQEIIEAYLKTS